MALQLFVSNSLNALSKRLCKKLPEGKGSIFQPVSIVAQTDGMTNWLTLEIARIKGIAINIDYKKPGDLVQHIYWLLGGNAEQVIARQSLDWLIYKVLGTAAFQNIFKDKAAYYNQDLITADAKKMSLATSLADLFDQYQIYRSYVIKQWNENDWRIAEPKFQWQAYICQAIKAEANQAIPDMTNVSAFLLESLQQPEKINLLKKRLPEVHLFGLSIITQYHIQIFYELAKHIDFNFYLLNPAPDVYWIEDRSEKEMLRIKSRNDKEWEANEGNSLLTNWGKVLQNTFAMLYQIENFINQQEDVDVEEPRRASLLGKIQNDIFHNKTEDIEFDPADLEDESILISSNYSLVREVESLYNYIADIFHHKKVENIKARDILVMVNNVEEYAPFIRAVFNNAPVKFPFHIADEPITQGDTPISGLTAILSINEQNFTAENVLQLLESRHIRNRFGIYDVGHIRACVQEANIRFGMKNAKEDDSYIVSWDYGLKRIMYGICMANEEEYADENNKSFFCLDNTEGNEQMQQVVRFAGFVNALIQSVEKRKKSKDLVGWVSYINEVMDDFIAYNEDENERYISAITNRLTKYEEIAAVVTLEFSFEIFSNHLLENLEREHQSKLFSGGGITFCSQIPMRSIPFKVVAMLGLGLNDFPRKDIKVDFDLIQQKRHLGDRNIKDNDKHLFLETVLSTKNKLYLSYIGRSVKDNSVRPPSILISELLDYIQDGMNRYARHHQNGKIDVRKNLVVYHPLHNFSSQYNKDDKRLINYLLAKTNPVKDLRDIQPSEDFHQLLNLSVRDIIAFCTDTVKFYYQHVLRIYLGDEDMLIPDTEMFTLNNLHKHQLSHSLIKAAINADNFSDEIEKLKKKGLLPLKNIALSHSSESVKIAENIYRQIKPIVGNAKPKKKNINLTIDGIHITGSIEDVFEDKYFYFNTGKSYDKNKIEAYVKYLLGFLSGEIKEAYFVAEHEIKHAALLDVDTAEKALRDIITMMQKGLDKMIVFGKEVLLKENEIKNLTDESLYEKLEAKITGYQQLVFDKYIIDSYHKGLLKADAIAEDYCWMYEHLYVESLNIFSGE